MKNVLQEWMARTCSSVLWWASGSSYSFFFQIFQFVKQDWVEWSRHQWRHPWRENFQQGLNPSEKQQSPFKYLVNRNAIKNNVKTNGNLTWTFAFCKVEFFTLLRRRRRRRHCDKKDSFFLKLSFLANFLHRQFWQKKKLSFLRTKKIWQQNSFF